MSRFDKIGLAAVVALLVAFTYAGITYKPTHTRHEKFSPIVRIYQENGAACTGLVVGPNAILTAQHCVLNDPMDLSMGVVDSLEVRPASNDKIGLHAKVYFTKPVSDQAVLKGDFKDFDIYQLRNAATPTKAYTNVVMACGYPLAKRMICMPLLYKDLVFIQFSPIEEPKFLYRMLGPNTIIPGMSGGPVFNENGDLIAVNTGVNEGAGESYLSPVYDLLSDIYPPEVVVK